MVKTQIICPKLAKNILFNDQTSQKALKQKRIPLQPINYQNMQKIVLTKSSNKEQWEKKDQENLLVSLFENIVKEPYLTFSWKMIEIQESLVKISRKIKKSYHSCSKKINQIKSVNQSKYQNLDLINFLIVYFKANNFKSKMGQDYIERIQELKSTKSQHMIMCEQMMNRMTQQQPTFMKLYDLIMKS